MFTGNNVWLAALLFIILIVVINLVMIASARGVRGFKGDDFLIGSNATKPWKKEDDDLRELHQRVQDLKSKQKDEDK